MGSRATTVDDSTNNTFLLFLSGSKGTKGTCNRTEERPHDVMEMWCWREQGQHPGDSRASTMFSSLLLLPKEMSVPREAQHMYEEETTP